MNRKSINATHFIARLGVCYFILSCAQRAFYSGWIRLESGTWPERLPQAIAKGVMFDLAASFYLLAPLALIFMFTPQRLINTFAFRAGVIVFSLIPMFTAAFSAIGEIFFFEEFRARYNFIAVDYLIYTTEVIQNVVESYNPLALAAAFVAPLIALGTIVHRMLKRLDRSASSAWDKPLHALAAAALIAAIFVTEDRVIKREPYWPRELAKNSLFTLFTAYNHNSINYPEFYSSMDSKTALKSARKALGGDFRDENSLTRTIKAYTPEKRYNVVLVAMESMSASFLGKFGNRQTLTPNLDKLAEQSLLFTSMYATGTRTIRGVEALMLALPPTPGQSILRRPKSEGMFNLGTVFAKKGYATQFIYGGYSYFDNMKPWFETNGFEVVDRNNFPADEIEFGNAWGVCDEDLFMQALKHQARMQANGQNFLQVILTTSNHRPYTYPEGKIDIPPKNGREGAIKYSDYSIGKFIEAAQTKPWFKDTIFIFVADHDASIAGGTDIPIKDYLIPAIIYSPGNIKPEVISKLASQIDLAPTILGLLGFSYDSKFFGEDLRVSNPNRAYLGTYQKIARLVPPHLTVLSPGKMVEVQDLDEKFEVKTSSTASVEDASVLSEPARTTIGIYQTASELFTQGLLKAN